MPLTQENQSEKAPPFLRQLAKDTEGIVSKYYKINKFKNAKSMTLE